MSNKTIHVCGFFGLLLLAYHLIFSPYFPLPNGRMGHDYLFVLNNLLDGYLWFKNNGFITPPWFTPSFCGGQAFFADPQSAFYSLAQFLTFSLDPLQAVYWTFLVFAGCGFWGMYLYSRDCLKLARLAALVAATVFMFNGFYAHRMVIGHFGYQSFMLLPLIGWLLLKTPGAKSTSKSSLSASIWAGILIAYCVHSGLSTLMIPAALAVISLACLCRLKSHEPIAKTFILRGLLAGTVAFGLCASKLNANLTLMASFPRDYYPLPGISNLGDLLTVVFQSLFYSSEHVYQTATPLWKNMQWSAMPHELAFGLTPLTLLALLIGAGVYVQAKRGVQALNLHKSDNILPGLLLGLILLIPLAMLYYSPEWNAFLKGIPLIGSTTSPYRWLMLYLPLLAACSGLAIQVSGKYQRVLATLLLLGIPLLNGLENREYYQQQPFDPAPIVNYYHALEDGKVQPGIHSVGDTHYPDGQPAIDNGLFLQGISPLHCYNPLYGYRLEKLQTAPLKSGPIDLLTATNSLNLHNPACLLFPEENNCRPWDAFSVAQRDELSRFANYQSYDFQKSKNQQMADLITGISFGLLVLFFFGKSVARINQARQSGFPSATNISSYLASHPGSLLLLITGMTGSLTFLITHLFIPNGMTDEMQRAIREIFVVWPQLIQPEQRERAAYLLTITLFPSLAILVSFLIYRNKVIKQDSIQPMPLYGYWLITLFIATIIFAAREAPFGQAFGFADYLPVRALLTTPNPWLFIGIFLAALFFSIRALYIDSSWQFEQLAGSKQIIDFLAVTLIVLVTARLAFIPEETGGLAWAPDLIHWAPIFEVAATAYLSSATVGADMVSQYGGLVEFVRPLLWLLNGDPLALLWFAFLMLAGASFCQWLAIRKLTGSAVLGLLTIGSIFYFTSIKFQTFACLQCGGLRWLWPSIFLCLAAFYNTKANFHFLPYLLFPVATYWNTETGLASSAAWIGWRLIANLLPVLVRAEWKTTWRTLLRQMIIPGIGMAAGILLVMLYIYNKSGQMLDAGLMSRFAKDFYLYGFGMLPMPGLHLWNVYALIAGYLFILGIRHYLRQHTTTEGDSNYGFIVFATLLFSLLFSYYQGRSFYANLLLVSYPLWLAVIIFLRQACIEKNNGQAGAHAKHPARMMGAVLISLGFAATLTSSFFLRPMVSPFNKQNIVEKTELHDWVEKTSDGRKPLFISFSAWRLMLLSGTAHPPSITPLAALLRRDQLDRYIAELNNQEYALYYDLSNDIYFAAENTYWANELKQVLEKKSTGKPLYFRNNQVNLMLIN